MDPNPESKGMKGNKDQDKSYHTSLAANQAQLHEDGGAALGGIQKVCVKHVATVYDKTLHVRWNSLLKQEVRMSLLTYH